MSDTYRKTVDGVKFKEGQYKDQSLHYGCGCYYCRGADNDEKDRKKKTLNKRELRKEIINAIQD